MGETIGLWILAVIIIIAIFAIKTLKSDPEEERQKQIDAEVEREAKRGGKIKSKSIGSGGLILAVIGIVIIASFFSQSPSTTPSTPSSPSPSDIKEYVVSQIKLKGFNWYKGGFDNVMTIDVIFENKSDSDVKDIELTCEHFAKSGTKIDSNKRVIYEVVKKGKSKRISKFNMGFIHSQAASSSCRVTDLVVQ